MDINVLLALTKEPTVLRLDRGWLVCVQPNTMLEIRPIQMRTRTRSFRWQIVFWKEWWSHFSKVARIQRPSLNQIIGNSKCKSGNRTWCIHQIALEFYWCYLRHQLTKVNHMVFAKCINKHLKFCWYVQITYVLPNYNELYECLRLTGIHL